MRRCFMPGTLFSGKAFLFLLAMVSLQTGSVLAGNQAEKNLLQAIEIDITTHLGDVRHFVEGDKLSFLLSLGRDSHVLILYQNAKQQIIQLLPNRNRPEYFLKAGLFISIPEPGAPFIFNIDPPFGKEVLWVFASVEGFPELAGKFRQDGTKKLSGNMDMIRKKLKARSRTAFGEVSYSLYTRAR